MANIYGEQGSEADWIVWIATIKQPAFKIIEQTYNLKNCDVQKKMASVIEAFYILEAQP
jgi:hypothetical protein